ncbi:hypothetical protein KIN20_034483, partial [Parelaphostrongylus tenuis]
HGLHWIQHESGRHQDSSDCCNVEILTLGELKVRYHDCFATLVQMVVRHQDDRGRVVVMLPVPSSPAVNSERPMERHSQASLKTTRRHARPVFYGIQEEDFRTKTMLEVRGSAHRRL